jgi:hypothetical protein
MLPPRYECDLVYTFSLAGTTANNFSFAAVAILIRYALSVDCSEH